MISVVIPVLNEKENVARLHAELLTILKGLDQEFEILFIDDGSTDGTPKELKRLTPVRVILFSRNYGKSQALQAGFRAAKGEYIFTMDGDMQDDPGEIPNFIKVLEEGNLDLVCGWKEHRRDSYLKRHVSKIANALTRFFTGTMVHDMNCGFKLYRKVVTESIDLYGDMHRYIPALVAAQGFSIGEVSVHHRARQFGVSKYGNFRRLFKSVFDFITLLLIRRFIDRPMHFFGVIGTVFGLVGTVILADLAYIKIVNGEAIGHRPLLMLGVLLVVIGVQLFSSGFLGELLIRQANLRKIYTVKEEFEHEETK